MQAAFVDIGAERTGFIHVSDMVAFEGSGGEDKSRTAANIADHLHDGKKIIVQVTKDPLGTKGALDHPVICIYPLPGTTATNGPYRYFAIDRGATGTGPPAQGVDKSTGRRTDERCWRIYPAHRRRGYWT